MAGCHLSHALNGELSWTTMDIFYSQSWNKCTQHNRKMHAHTHTFFFCESLTFPAHTCTLFLFCSALCGLGLLSGAITSSTGGEGPLIPVLLFAIPSMLLPFGGEQGDESSRGWNRTSHHLLRASVWSHTCTCSNTHTQKKEKP